MSENDKPPKSKKKVVIKSYNGVTWETIFSGPWTRRDYKKIQRVLAVKFSAMERQRNLQRLIDAKDTSVQPLSVNISPEQRNENDPSTV